MTGSDKINWFVSNCSPKPWPRFIEKVYCAIYLTCVSSSKCVLFLEIAQANGGNDITDAVITVPLHFSDEQRVAMRYIIIISYSFAELVVPYSHP